MFFATFEKFDQSLLLCYSKCPRAGDNARCSSVISYGTVLVQKYHHVLRHLRKVRPEPSVVLQQVPPCRRQCAVQLGDQLRHRLGEKVPSCSSPPSKSSTRAFCCATASAPVQATMRGAAR